MPRYHFNVHDGVESPDLVGIEMPDLRTAREEAVRYAGSLLEEAANKRSVGEDWCLEVTNAAGVIQFSFTFTVSDGLGEGEL